MTPAKAMNEVFLDTGDVTVTVDPVRRDAWIYDGYNKYEQSKKRGFAYDKMAFQQVLGWESASRGDVPLFLPTTQMLDRSQKFPIPQGQGCRGWNGYDRNSERYGLLPVISQQLYDNSLQNKDPGVIEHEIREARRRAGARLFDTSGYTR